MYAVIETGGKQYRVELGTELEVELLDVTPGGTITLDRVLLVADGDTASIGRPHVANATVSAEVLRQDRAKKVISFKYRPKARRRVKKGHRQDLTVLRISDIILDGRSAAASEAKAADARKTERQRLEEAAKRQAEADAALAAKLAKAATPKTEAPAKPGRGKPAGAKAKPTAAKATPPTGLKAKPAAAKAGSAATAKTAPQKTPTTKPAAKAADSKTARPRATKKDE